MPLLERLTTSAHLDEYAAAYERASGYRVSLDYLRRSLVFGVLRGGRLRGGVVISGQAPFRTFDRIPAPHRAAVAGAIDPADTVEIACVWLDGRLRGTRYALAFWPAVLLEASRRGAGHVLFGTESRGLCNLYRAAGPTLLYSGPVTVDGVRRHGWVFTAPVALLWRAIRRMTVHKMRRAGRTPAPTFDRECVVYVPVRERRRPAPARRAFAVPLRGLAAAGGEIVRRSLGRMTSTDRRHAEAALAAAAVEGGWAVVTGASSGIGLAFVQRLAARGAGLLLISDEPGVSAVAERLRFEYGVRAEAFVADLSSEHGAATALGWIGSRRVEVLVNNAGIGAKGLFVNGAPDEYARMIGVNVLAPVLLTRGLLPGMVARGRGAVIHVASVNALAPMPRSAVYSATKTFLLAYATAVAHETRARGVVLQTLLPGTTATAFHDKQRTTLPSWALTPERVAASSLAALGREPVHVPGALNKALRVLASLLPLSARTAAAEAALTASLGESSAAPAAVRHELIA